MIMCSRESPCRILCAEDNPVLIMLLESSSEEFLDSNLIINIKTTLKETIEEIKTADKPYDIILLDAQLPDATDFEGLDAIHALDPDAWIYLFTGFLDESHRAEAKSRGAKNFILKGSLDLQSLIIILHEGAENRRNQERLKSDRNFWKDKAHDLEAECEMLQSQLQYIQPAIKDESIKQSFKKLERHAHELKEGLRLLAIAR